MIDSSTFGSFDCLFPRSCVTFPLCDVRMLPKMAQVTKRPAPQAKTPTAQCGPGVPCRGSHSGKPVPLTHMTWGIPRHACLYSWEGSVSGAQEWARLPALGGLGPSGSVRSILSRAALPRLPDSNKQKEASLHIIIIIIIIINATDSGSRSRHSHKHSAISLQPSSTHIDSTVLVLVLLFYPH